MIKIASTICPPGLWTGSLDRKTGCCLRVAAALVLCTVAFDVRGSVIEVARGELQVLWGERLVDVSNTSAKSVLHQPSFAGPALVLDAPWEGDSCNYFTVFRDGDIVRLYYKAGCSRIYGKYSRIKNTDGTDKMRICYAESRDGGLTFQRPKLGMWEVGGSKENNIIHPFRDNAFVFRDDNSKCPPGERYKLVYEKTPPGAVNPDGTRKKGKPQLWYKYSSDGIHFGGDRFVSDQGNFDSLNTMCWDSVRGEYRCFVRGVHDPALGMPKHIRIMRDIRVCTSRDAVKWTDTQPIDFGADAEDYQLYTNVIEPYYRNPSIFVGFPARYVERAGWSDSFERLCGADRRKDRMKLYSPRGGTVIWDDIFIWSYDGVKFMRTDEAFIRPGPEHPERNWCYGDKSVARGLLEMPGLRGVDPEIGFYATEGNLTGHNCVLNRYTIRLDGFMSWQAPYAGARLVTKRLVFGGSEMQLNFSTSARGFIYIKIRDDDGNTCRSHEIFGDKVDRTIGWEAGKLADFAGKPVTIEFDMRDADIYAFRFR